jgi:hypothetical protein
MDTDGRQEFLTAKGAEEGGSGFMPRPSGVGTPSLKRSDKEQLRYFLFLGLSDPSSPLFQPSFDLLGSLCVEVL